MKKYLLLITIIIFSNCEHDIFGPNEGSLFGVVKDDNNNFVQGAIISLTYNDSSGNEITLNEITNENGIYSIEDIALERQEVKVEAYGLKTITKHILFKQATNNKEYDISMIGAPKITDVSIDKNNLSKTDNEETILNMIVFDAYNSDDSSNEYVARCKIFDKTGVLKLIKEEFELIGQYSFKLTIKASDMDVGEYKLEFEVFDTNNLYHKYQEQISLKIN